jgi:hypothetical protein
MQSVVAMLGGAVLTGGDRLLALSCDEPARTQVTARGIGAFSSADVALLDEIADTILPETSTPGAKAAKTGAFMALAASDVYTQENLEVFRNGLRKVDEAAQSAHGVGFMQASSAQRLAVLQALDREQKAVMDARRAPPSNRAPLPTAATSEPPHYFRLLKELALLGYFTSEIGCTRALQYAESPGRYDPCAPYAPGDRAWAGHA